MKELEEQFSFTPASTSPLDTGKYVLISNPSISIHDSTQYGGGYAPGVDNGDGTISDTHANLMWKKDDSYKEYGYGITWFEAHDYCEMLNDKKFAGYDDWRLPGIEESKSLFSFVQSNSDKDGAEIHISDLFENGGGHNTWTYEEKPDYQQYAQKFSFVTGNDIWEHKDNEYSHCRVTRDVVQDEWEPEWRKDTKTFER